jgi:hypothetical protein
MSASVLPTSWEWSTNVAIRCRYPSASSPIVAEHSLAASESANSTKVIDDQQSDASRRADDQYSNLSVLVRLRRSPTTNRGWLLAWSSPYQFGNPLRLPNQPFDQFVIRAVHPASRFLRRSYHPSPMPNPSPYHHIRADTSPSRAKLHGYRPEGLSLASDPNESATMRA